MQADHHVLVVLRFATCPHKEKATTSNTIINTTTATHWYWLDAQRQSALIDSPGFQEFGLHHLRPEALAQWMPDLARHLGHCRFHNCTHRHEPGCGVRPAVGLDGAAGIAPSRWRLYEQLHDELRAAAAQIR